MLIDTSKKKILIKKQKIADDFLKRGIGLMFSKRKKFDYSLIFDLERTTLIGASIHMFFVFFPINVLFLDNSKKIVDIKQNLKPFNLYFPKKPARYIIELPIEIDVKNLKIGTKLKWN